MVRVRCNWYALDMLSVRQSTPQSSEAQHRTVSVLFRNALVFFSRIIVFWFSNLPPFRSFRLLFANCFFDNNICTWYNLNFLELSILMCFRHVSFYPNKGPVLKKFTLAEDCKWDTKGNPIRLDAEGKKTSEKPTLAKARKGFRGSIVRKIEDRRILGELNC